MTLSDEPGPALAERADLSALLDRATDEHDVDALQDLYAATVGRLYAVALLIAGRRELAEEIVADVFIRIGKGQAGWSRAAGSPLAFLTGLTRRMALERVRKRPAAGASDQASVELLSTVRARDRFAGDQIAPLCTDPALKGMAPQQRALLIAAYLFGESRSELAGRAGLPEDEVRPLIASALKALRPPSARHSADHDKPAADAAVLAR